MLGNDVVDLRDPETSPGALHARFDQRVFDRAERRLLEGSPSPRRLRWTLWAAKESSFKAERRIDAHTVFSPVRFEVRRVSDSGAQVVHGRRCFGVSFAHRDELVHAIAIAEEPQAAGTLIAASIREAGLAPSLAARSLAIAWLASHLRIDPSRLSIDPRSKIPRVRIDGERGAIALSLSHHGEGIAFAALVPPTCDAAWLASPGVVT